MSKNHGNQFPPTHRSPGATWATGAELQQLARTFRIINDSPSDLIITHSPEGVHIMLREKPMVQSYYDADTSEHAFTFDLPFKYEWVNAADYSEIRVPEASTGTFYFVVYQDTAQSWNRVYPIAYRVLRICHSLASLGGTRYRQIISTPPFAGGDAYGWQVAPNPVYVTLARVILYGTSAAPIITQIGREQLAGYWGNFNLMGAHGVMWYDNPPSGTVLQFQGGSVRADRTGGYGSLLAPRSLACSTLTASMSYLCEEDMDTGAITAKLTTGSSTTGSADKFPRCIVKVAANSRLENIAPVRWVVGYEPPP